MAREDVLSTQNYADQAFHWYSLVGGFAGPAPLLGSRVLNFTLLSALSCVLYVSACVPVKLLKQRHLLLTVSKARA